MKFLKILAWGVSGLMTCVLAFAVIILALVVLMAFVWAVVWLIFHLWWLCIAAAGIGILYWLGVVARDVWEVWLDAR